MKQIVVALVALVLGVAYLAWSSREGGQSGLRADTAGEATGSAAGAPVEPRARESWPGQFDRRPQATPTAVSTAAGRPTTEPGSEARAAEFAARKEALLAEGKALIGQRRYAEAARLLQPWLTEQDHDLFALWSEASNARKQAEREEKIAQLQAQVDALPADAHRQRAILFGKMAQLDRKNFHYQEEALRYGLLANPELAGGE